VYSSKKLGLVKKAIVISPQSWDEMFVSKHHYAVELSKLGYEVFFINPPKEIKIIAVPKVSIETTEFDNLLVVKYSTFFSRYLKFHFLLLYNLLIIFQRWIIFWKIGNPDLIMSFDLANNFPLSGVKCKKIFFAADEPKNLVNLAAAKSADIIVSVSQHILDIYEQKYPRIRKLLINHGLSDEFLCDSVCLLKKYSGINVGMSGNFLFNDIDYPVLKQIIEENTNVNFHFYGNYSKTTNINLYIDKIKYIESFLKKNNCFFHGIKSKLELSVEINQMDAFLICYHPNTGQSSGSNSHKILEFLSTGKVVFSNNFTYYNKTDLFVMNNSRGDNKDLLEIFKKGIENLDLLNCTMNQAKRKDFAFDNLYSKNILKILNTSIFFAQD
jgi:hypothetical protein